jgi:uncharacterized protein (DUF2336 family)
MNAVSGLISDLEESIARGSQERRVETLQRVMDLFLGDADSLTEEQIDLFDVVIARLAAAIETRARAELAARLADVGHAPRGVIRSLAHDDIQVARPVLTRSDRLSDDDLVAVALAKGRDHMLAISERAVLTEPVTDVLVSRGDRVVVHAVAGNPGARFSEVSIAALVDRSRADAALQTLLGQRDDLAEGHVRQLVEIAKETARRRLAESVPDAVRPAVAGAVELGGAKVEAAMVPGGRDYSQALEAVQALAEERALEEADLVAFGARGQFEGAVCAMAHLSGLSIASVERLFIGPEADLLLVVGKAHGWSWATMRTLLKLRDADQAAPHLLKRAEDTYEGLASATAQRVVQFIRVREASQRQAAEAAATRRQIRSKTR